jgi:predicted metalloprotease with PDZ domain
MNISWIIPATIILNILNTHIEFGLYTYLRAFNNIIIDIKNRSLYLHRFKETSVNEPTYDYGFRNRTDICRGWVVSWLTRNGDAVRAGMELGDTIVAVNGKDVRAYTWDEEDNINKTPKHTLDIISSNGIKKSLSLEARKRW